MFIRINLYIYFKKIVYTNATVFPDLPTVFSINLNNWIPIPKFILDYVISYIINFLNIIPKIKDINLSNIPSPIKELITPIINKLNTINITLTNDDYKYIIIMILLGILEIKFLDLFLL